MNILAFVILFLFLFWMAGFFLIWMFADTERHEFSIKIIGIVIITILTVPLGNGLFFLFDNFCTEKTVNYDVVTDQVYSVLADVSGNSRYVYYNFGNFMHKRGVLTIRKMHIFRTVVRVFDFEHKNDICLILRICQILSLKVQFHIASIVPYISHHFNFISKKTYRNTYDKFFFN